MAQILTVEDDENSRLIVRDLLEDLGYEIIEAWSGPDGVRAAEAHQPALILMDVQLPGFDGFEAIRRIQSNPGLRHIPIVVVTSYAMHDDAARAREAGCRYISKPFKATVLLDVIRDCLP